MSVPYAEVIGDPIVHSKSPLIHTFWLRKLGLSHDYRRTLVKPQEIGTYLKQRRTDPDWCGCNVTLPHKEAVVPHLDTSSGDAAQIGAVNCVIRKGGKEPSLIGRNTDWKGFIEPLQPWISKGCTYRFAHVVGAGGAAAAVCYALSRASFTIVSLNRNADKALALRRRLDLFDDDLVVPLPGSQLSYGIDDADRSDRIDLLINATPLGMEGFPPLLFPLERVPRDVLVYDLVYHPLETALLRAARERGMPTIDGLSMLIGQAAEAFQLFFAESAPREYDRELRELLTS